MWRSGRPGGRPISHTPHTVSCESHTAHCESTVSHTPTPTHTHTHQITRYHVSPTKHPRNKKPKPRNAKQQRGRGSRKSKTKAFFDQLISPTGDGRGSNAQRAPQEIGESPPPPWVSGTTDKAQAPRTSMGGFPWCWGLGVRRSTAWGLGASKQRQGLDCTWHLGAGGGWGLGAGGRGPVRGPRSRSGSRVVLVHWCCY
jgi:hypothetical protein